MNRRGSKCVTKRWTLTNQSKVWFSRKFYRRITRAQVFITTTREDLRNRQRRAVDQVPLLLSIGKHHRKSLSREYHLQQALVKVMPRRHMSRLLMTKRISRFVARTQSRSFKNWSLTHLYQNPNHRWIGCHIQTDSITPSAKIISSRMRTETLLKLGEAFNSSHSITTSNFISLRLIPRLQCLVARNTVVSTSQCMSLQPHKRQEKNTRTRMKYSQEPLV